MQKTIEEVATALGKRGFQQRNPGTWGRRGLTVGFRPQDNSFMGHWTDGRHHEYVFFDFPSDNQEKCHCEFALLMQWVGERQLFPGASEQLAVAA